MTDKPSKASYQGVDWDALAKKQNSRAWQIIRKHTPLHPAISVRVSREEFDAMLSKLKGLLEE